jgi:hypothetical protein
MNAPRSVLDGEGVGRNYISIVPDGSHSKRFQMSLP